MMTSIRQGSFFDRHPILVPASLFFICWIPYLVIFLRRNIAFGELGDAYPIESGMYWFLFAIQLGVCVISHSLTIRTIVRLYAPRWLIWGSIAFYALSPAWGLMTAADIRHPLFAAVFCVFTSSCTFSLYSKKVPRWLWAQLAGGALSVCLLRGEGILIILPTLLLVMANKTAEWWSLDRSQSVGKRLAAHFSRLDTMKSNAHKKEESRWSDMCAAFLVLSATGLLFLLTYCAGWGLPLGEPSYGVESATSTAATTRPGVLFSANLTGTGDVGGIMPFAAIIDNSVYESLAVGAGNAIFAFQCLPIENLTFSWVVYLVLLAASLPFAVAAAIGRHPHGSRNVAKLRKSSSGSADATRTSDARPLIIGFPMVMIIVIMLFTPTDMTIRYLMPVLAAQPMFFAAIFTSLRPS